MTCKVGFIGAGQMARALVQGLVAAGLVGAERVWASDPDEEARARFRDLLPEARVGGSARIVVETCEIVFLAVKPQHISSVFAEIAGHGANAATLYISIVAGVTMETLRTGLGTSKVVRVMPNTPCLIGEGATGYCVGEGVTQHESAVVAKFLGAVGLAIALPETHMDAVTGLSGSGPAFVYQIIEALSDGGVRVGLPRDVATQLAAQTVLGAARMVLETGEHPGVLKDRVASPGGTTIAGIHALETGRLRATLIDAVVQATERAKELGRRVEPR